MIRFIPGFIAAIAAFVVLKLIGWAVSLSLQAVIFLAVWLLVAVIVDYMMQRYGNGRPGGPPV